MLKRRKRISRYTRPNLPALRPKAHAHAKKRFETKLASKRKVSAWDSL